MWNKTRTYKNDYTKQEDEMLWELHNIRHKQYLKRRNRSAEDINKDALEILKKWGLEKRIRTKQ